MDPHKVVKPKEVRAGSEGSNRTGLDNARTSTNTVQPRPPRYNKKTARSLSMPSDYSTIGGGSSSSVVAGGAGGDYGSRRYPSDGGSVGSVASSRSNGSSSWKEASRTKKGRVRGEGTGAGGSSVMSGVSRSGSERSR